jgi:hypothetical protein
VHPTLLAPRYPLTATVSIPIRDGQHFSSLVEAIQHNLGHLVTDHPFANSLSAMAIDLAESLGRCEDRHYGPLARELRSVLHALTSWRPRADAGW